MAEDNNAQQQQFALQRIYIKDMSFESPQGVKAFTQQWKPQVKMDLNTRHEKIDDNNYEVVLTLTITATQDDDVAFLVELQQAGVFFCKGIQGPQLGQVLGALCPGILFPYARETVDSIVTKGSFPALMLAPVNFDALYQQALTQQQQKQKEAAH
jgi:preprotein translocase subunit SecB